SDQDLFKRLHNEFSVIFLVFDKLNSAFSPPSYSVWTTLLANVHDTLLEIARLSSILL
ncbi:hypothetical protein BgiMline_019956, partial [Biomphalaria glabrata]